MIKKLLSKIKQFIILQNKNYTIDGFNIELSKKHMLPLHQIFFCYYDKVLPAITALSNTNNKDALVIDIGANIGDTLFSLVKHTSASFLCIEPDDGFYQLLEKNVASLPERYKCKVKCLKSFVVLDTSENIKLEKVLGTAHKIVCEEAGSNNNSATLKDIIIKNNIKPADIDLIKVDTDGFDWECLMSMGDLITETNAFLYWENQIDKGNKHQKEGYLNLVNYLKNAGYDYFFCFDNFGNFISSGNADYLIEINGYLDRLNEKKTARTIYYVDVLACKESAVSGVNEMLKQFYQS